ncbi:hypothetical protein KI387_021228, partial [Taxus chinensis]
VSVVKPLKILSVTTSPEFTDLPFLTLLGSFSDLEELKLTATFIQDMAVGKILAAEREVAAEKVLSHLTFPNLKQSSAHSRGIGSTFELVADVAVAANNMLKASLTNPQLSRKVPDENEEKAKTNDSREPMPDPMDPSVRDGWVSGG